MSALRVKRITIHRSGVRRVMGAPFMVREMRRRMNKVRLLAISIAPIDSGNYVSRFVEPGALESGVNGAGVAFARLSNDATSEEGAPYGYFLEVGTKYMRAQHILRRALRAAGN